VPAPDYTLAYADALGAIRKILEAKAKEATPGEKLVRIGWVIAALPAELRETIIREAQNRALIGWSSGLKPTDWDVASPPMERT
jgi:hypothetical protein